MTTFSAALCLAVGIIMILNNHSFFHKALPYAMLLLGFLGIVDLLNLVINHVYFYDIFNRCSLPTICTVVLDAQDAFHDYSASVVTAGYSIFADAGNRLPR